MGQCRSAVPGPPGFSTTRCRQESSRCGALTFRNTEGAFYNKPFALAVGKEPIRFALLVGWKEPPTGSGSTRRPSCCGRQEEPASRIFSAAASADFYFSVLGPSIANMPGQVFFFGFGTPNEKQATAFLQEMKAMIGMCPPPPRRRNVAVFKKSVLLPALGHRLFEVSARNIEGPAPALSGPLVVVGD